MALFENPEQHEVGIEEMDDDHIRLYSFINRVHKHMANLESRDLLLPLVDVLARYLADHFEREEALFTRHQYGDLPKHHDAHQHLLAAVRSFETAYVNGEPLSVSGFFAQIKTWMDQHSAMDISAANYVKAHVERTDPSNY